MSDSIEEETAIPGQTQTETKSAEENKREQIDTITNKAQTLHLLKPKGLTLTILFQGSSLNYGEGFGNYSELKKLNRYNGVLYSVSSRQSMRYSIFVQGVKEFGWEPSLVRPAGREISSNENNDTEGRDTINDDSSFGKKSVTQLLSTIVASPETDLFGYFDTNIQITDSEETANSAGKSEKNKTVEATVSRTSVVRISPAISMEPYQGDTEMLTNKFQGDKIQAQPNIATSEIHQSIYCYTISIDLHRVGTEQDEIGTRMSFGGGKDNPNNSKAFQKFQNYIRSQQISYDERKKRVLQLLDIIGRLYRDIRGRREDLKPLFIVGGVYDVCNPFFLNVVKIDNNKLGKKDFQPRIKPEPLVQLLKDTSYTIYGIDKNDKKATTSSKNIRDETFIGIRDGFFNNMKDDFNISDQDNFFGNVASPEVAISKVKQMVERYYNIELAEDYNMINNNAITTTNSST